MESETHRKIWESAIRPLRDSVVRGEAHKAASAPDEPPPADAQSVYHLMRSIAHRLDRLEQRIECQEVTERARGVRRARSLRTIAILLAAAAAAAVVWGAVASIPRADPFLVSGHRAPADRGGPGDPWP